MVIIMDMDSGKYGEGEFDASQEEVLNAQWLPHQFQPECQLGLQQAVPETVTRRMPLIEDVEAFLSNVYRNQR